MKVTLVFVCFLLFSGVLSIPFQDQVALANSLLFGKKSDPDKWICKVCNDKNKPLSIPLLLENTQIDIATFISVYKNFVVLAFRYTDTLKNVKQDILYFTQTEVPYCKGCKVQAQYLNMWNSIKEKMIAQLRQIKSQYPDIDQLLLTGISMGGGQAALALVDIKAANIFSDIKMTTFGAPRVGNNEWAANF